MQTQSGGFSSAAKMISATIFLVAFAAGANAANFIIRNNEGGDIWVGIQGNPGHPHLRNGGFILGQYQEVSVGAPDNWAGRFWGRTWCDRGNNHCLTGDCGNRLECNGAGGVPPATLLEITLKGAGGLDFYDVSLVDGFNIPASIEPIGGRGDGGQYSCKKAGCPAHINWDCPRELQLQTNHGVLGCKSACLAFNTDQYCCRFPCCGTPQTCRSSNWPHNYPKFFKDRCPDAYSYAYDDHKSTFTCRANTYKLIFG